MGQRLYTDSEIEQYAHDLLQDETIDTPLTTKEFDKVTGNDNGYPSRTTFYRYLGRDRLKRLGVLISMQHRVDRFVENIQEEGPGIYNAKDLNELIPKFNMKKSRILLEMVDRQDNPISVSFNGGGGGRTGARYYISIDGVDRYADIKQHLDPDMQKVFEDTLDYGRRPSAVAAALYYMKHDDVTQRDAAEKFGTTTVSLRANIDYLTNNYQDYPAVEA